MAGNTVPTPERLTRSIWAWALLGLTAVRLVVAGSAPLSPDEAYYWVWSKALAPGYLDHPPMVALWIRMGTALLGDSALGVRLFGPLAAAAGSVLLVRAGDALRPGSGVRAAVLLNATLMLGAGSVTMTPDTPLIFFWTVALYALVRIATGGDGWWWLVVGAASGLGLDSKYTAALLGVGIALWLLGPMRGALRTPWPWAGGALALALFAPVVWWNAGHHWASFVKQGGRTGDFAPGRAAVFLGELLMGQMGLATPAVFALMAAGSLAAVRRWRAVGPCLLAALIVPGAVVFVQHALGDRVQANWVAVLYPAAALAGARYARWVWPAAAVGFGLTALLYVQASLAPLPLPRALDPTMRLAGFEGLAAQAAAVPDVAFLAAEEYGLGGLLAFHQGLPVVAAAPRWRLFDLAAPVPGASGLLVVSVRRREGPDPALWQSVEAAGTATRGRGGVVAETYRLYRVTLRPGAPAAVLPSRSLP